MFETKHCFFGKGHAFLEARKSKKKTCHFDVSFGWALRISFGNNTMMPSNNPT